MKFSTRLLLNFFLLLCLAAPVQAAEPFELTLQAFRTAQPENPVLAVLTLTPRPGWYAYGNVQGPSGFPTVITAASSGNSMSPLYPPPILGQDPLDPSLTVDLYDGPTPFFIPLGNGPTTVTAGIKALLCSATTCQPIKEQLELTVADAGDLPLAEDQVWWPRFLLSVPGAGEDLAPDPTNTVDADGAPAVRTFAPRYFAPGLGSRHCQKRPRWPFWPV